ncbi:MAG: tRNA (adenosine(37)-N6)-threonylcarbamoyltransferase complex ATPase subunit type 1 TsaE [Clostridia bacterium]|nr:tRNA (adenosine(37)-N6)-threonylcarbamoyltransferase complex ATPase subunit type 1 TsaE [Clostridia bacterium]
MKYIFESKKISHTKKIAKFVKKHLKSNDVILLSGDLGAGKTTFTKFLLKLLGVKEIVSSPTFTIFKNYYAKDRVVYHFDLYRLEEESELVELNFFEIVNNMTSDQLILIEWPDIALDYIKRSVMRINVKYTESQNRVYEVEINE